MIIRRVSPFSVAKIAGLLYALLGLIIGACISLVMLAFGAALPQDEAFAGPGAAMFRVMFSAGAVVILPIMYGLFGFIMTAIMAALYNLVAGWVGGIEIDAQ